MESGSGVDVASLVVEHAKDYPITDGIYPKYGTAGFRGPAEKFAPIAFRCGVIAALRSYAAMGDCGIVITASHNPVGDNGVKLVDVNGEMFPKNWERYAEELVEADTAEKVGKVCDSIIEREQIRMVRPDEDPLMVFAGHDSRPSSPGLLKDAIRGMEAMKVEVAFEAGLQTTPQVHYRVWRRHQKIACGEFQWLKYMSGGFMRMARGTYGRHGVLTVDCANGVAAQKLERLGNCPGAIPQGYHFDLKNTGDGTLNAKCGAEYVHKQNALPIGFDSIDDWQRCASVDGDVDRVVYFTRAAGKTIVLDGDRIAALAALHVQSTLEKNPEYKKTYTTGVVLTAYSNSALVKYLKEQGVEVVIAPTGVKNLYSAAKEFQIGIYYEANGHGSIVFSPEAAKRLKEAEAAETEEPGDFELLALMETMNQTVGDAVSNILMVEAILRIREWTLEDWMKLYEPLPSKTVAVSVNNIAALKTDASETKCIAPPALQSEIDKIVTAYPNSRAFVRPSGTEALVRIYGECTTQSAVDEMMQKLTTCVQKALKN